MREEKEVLTVVLAGGHSLADSIDELTDGKQIVLTLGSLIINGEASCNRAISFT